MKLLLNLIFSKFCKRNNFHNIFNKYNKKRKEMNKKIAIIGTGYVGLTSGVCFSHLDSKMICVDNEFVLSKVSMII